MRQAIALALAGIIGLGLIAARASGQGPTNKSAAKEARGGAAPLQRSGGANETAKRGVELATNGRCMVFYWRRRYLRGMVCAAPKGGEAGRFLHDGPFSQRISLTPCCAL